MLAALIAAVAIPNARAQIVVLSSGIEERQAVAGETYTGRIVIANASKRPQSVRIYQADYHFLADGSVRFDDPGTNARSNARWIVPQSQRVTVPPEGEVRIPYAVLVPADDSLRGTYWSAILFEGTAPSLTGAAAGSPEAGIAPGDRHFVQVATTIGSSSKCTVQLEKPVATTNRETGAASLDLDVVGAGDRACRPTLSVELYDAQGGLRSRASQTRGLLYPGTSLRQRFGFGKLPPGTYKAVVFADTGNGTVLAEEFTIQY